jgi:prepilin signal peptidase PulO-like enzyme (type II secretory pathway)
VLIVVGLVLGCGLGELMRRRLNRLAYRLGPQAGGVAEGVGVRPVLGEGQGTGEDRGEGPTLGEGQGTAEVVGDGAALAETDRPVPGRRWWIPVLLGLAWAAVAGTVTGWDQPGIVLDQPWALIGWLGFAAIGIWLAAIDLDVRRLPDTGQLGLALVVLVGAAGQYLDQPSRWLVGLGCAVACGLVFWVIHRLSQGSLGFGDVKLVATCGWWLGCLSLTAVWTGLILACLLAVAFSLLARQRHFAFGPWLVAGTLVAGLLCWA